MDDDGRTPVDVRASAGYIVLVPSYIKPLHSAVNKVESPTPLNRDNTGTFEIPMQYDAAVFLLVRVSFVFAGIPAACQRGSGH